MIRNSVRSAHNGMRVAAGLGSLLSFLISGCGMQEAQLPPPDWTLLATGLEQPQQTEYLGQGDGGLLHVSYYGIKVGSPQYMALPAAEQSKLVKLQQSILHSVKFQPTAELPGWELTGVLVVRDSGQPERRQEIVLKVPKDWNGRLAVAGTPGTRSEFASEAVLASWLLQRGYAYVAGNKGMTNGGADGNLTLLGKTHATQHWGAMMLDLASWAQQSLRAATGMTPTQTYAVGLSNGGYQVRRALELDHQRVQKQAPRLFSGGIEWAGVYWPDARVLDKDRSGSVTPAEYLTAMPLVSSNEQAALAMGYQYDAATRTTTKAFAESPPFSAAHAGMKTSGFAAPSAILWGAYNSLFDSLKSKIPAYKGVGYYNLTAYYYRADLLGHDAKESAPYSCFLPDGAQRPPFYDYLAAAVDAGWTSESVNWALKNANTAEFSAPLISLHGDRDALIGVLSHGYAYDDAVKAHGNPALHRLYVIENGNHVDAHADGFLDYNVNGQAGEEGMADLLTPMQPYVERAFDLLTDWVEKGQAPRPSRTIATDPKNDIVDAKLIDL